MLLPTRAAMMAAEVLPPALCGAMGLLFLLSAGACVAFARILRASNERQDRLRNSAAWEAAKEVRAGGPGHRSIGIYLACCCHHQPPPPAVRPPCTRRERSGARERVVGAFATHARTHCFPAYHIYIYIYIYICIYMKKKHAMIFTIPPTHPLIKYVKVPVEVFCSLRGCDEETPDLFRQLAVQTHRAFTLRVVVDSEWDEAWPVARKEVATANRKGAAWREATVEVLRDRFPAGGTRKSAALLQCLDSLAPETRAVFLVDGDQTLPPDYITSLVAEVSSFPRGLEGREELEKRGMLKGKKGDVGEEGICRCRGPFSERDIMARGGLHRWKRPPPPAPTAASLAPCCRPPTSPHSPRTLSSLAFPKP